MRYPLIVFTLIALSLTGCLTDNDACDNHDLFYRDFCMEPLPQYELKGYKKKCGYTYLYDCNRDAATGLDENKVIIGQCVAEGETIKWCTE